MRGSRAVPGLVPILMIAMVGCESSDPVGPTAGDRVSVRIEGPELLDGGRRYSWLAVADGDGDYEYVWDVDWLNDDEQSLRVHGQELVLEAERPRDFRLRVRLLENGRQVAAATRGSICEDEYLVVEEDTRIQPCFDAN